MRVNIRKSLRDQYVKPHYVNESITLEDDGSTRTRSERFETATAAFADAALVASKFDEISMSGGVLRDFLHETYITNKQEQL